MDVVTCFSFFSLLYVETADRPGLLVDLVKIITDINIAVESGEFDTEVYVYIIIQKCKFIFSDLVFQNECFNLINGP